jgi:hypothetical protein
MSELSPDYTAARDALLATRPQTTEAEAAEALPHVYGVIVDIGFNPLFTVAAFADGTTSAHDGNGHSVTGLGESMETLVLGRGVLRSVEENIGSFRPVDSTPLPSFGRVRFTVLTYDGLLGAETDGAALLKGQHPLSKAFTAVMAIMEQARHAASQLKATPPN